MKYVFIFLCFYCFSIEHISSENELFLKLLKIDQVLENASIGISIKDIEGNEIFDYNGNTSLIPASTLKIVTTATALEILGSEYRFETHLLVENNNRQHIIVRGFGDPTLGSEFSFPSPTLFLNTWVDRISKQVLKNHTIDITINDSYFGYQGVSMKWLFEDLGNYYASATYGISFLDNTYRLYLNSIQKSIGMCPKIVKVEPSIPGLIFDNQIIINNLGSTNAYINGFPGSEIRRLI